VDGASIPRIFFSIIFPLMKPITITSMIFNTMWIWNDFIAPNIFLSSRANTTLVLEVFRAKGQFTTNWPVFMTLSVIIIFPIFVFYLFMQKHIIKGLTAGAVKG
jgi:raffinose/stachyose/melibiose transport system permease protein